MYINARDIKVKPAALALLILLPLSAIAAPLTSSSRLILRSAATSGGAIASSDTLKLAHASAQASVSSFTGAGIRLYTGLMHQLAQPGSVTSITAVSKSTGTLDLAWTAPGLDGSLGAVTGGVYRIDYSSEASHVFSPTTYRVEFATNVTPGQADSYRLTGLLPNTTYYAKIYLADGRKMVAEDSKKSEESTLAHPPASPVLSAVDATSVTFTWSLPAGGAEGFLVDGSSTNFAGGSVLSTQTANGGLLTLTVSGLDPDTTYYFKLASLNWQGDKNFSTIFAVRTGAGGPLPVTGMVMAGLRMEHKITLTWNNRVYLDPDGVLVQVSKTPITESPVDGTSYSVGQVLADGSVVKSTAAGTSYTEDDLALDTTRYFKLYSKTTSNKFSVAVSTMGILDLPPMAPAGYSASMAPGASVIALNWAGVRSSMDGSIFMSTASPSSWEIHHYDVYRATGIAHPNWVKLATIPWTSTSYLAEVPDPAKTYYYKVVGRDLFDEGDSDDSMVADTKGNLYAVAKDEVSRIMIPAHLVNTLKATGNKYGMDMLVRATELPADLTGKVFKSVRFDPYLAPSGLNAPMQWDKAQLEVALHYQTQNGKIVPSAGKDILSPASGGSPAASPAISEADVASKLAAYWYNNVDYIKLFGQVNPADQTVLLQSAMLGAFQIRNVLRAGAFEFDIAAVSNKALTPNGDGLNDTVVFIFDNPKDSSFSGRIYDTRGAFVADMRAGPLAGGSLLWDGKANGLVVPGGVYVYQIKSEGRTFNGTVMVIR